MAFSPLLFLSPSRTETYIGRQRTRNRKLSNRVKKEWARGLCEEEERWGGGMNGGKEVNLHILERAGFFIKKRLKLIYACVLLTHCTLCVSVLSPWKNKGSPPVSLSYLSPSLCVACEHFSTFMEWFHGEKKLIQGVISAQTPSSDTKACSCFPMLIFVRAGKNAAFQFPLNLWGRIQECKREALTGLELTMKSWCQLNQGHLLNS